MSQGHLDVKSSDVALDAATLQYLEMQSTWLVIMFDQIMFMGVLKHSGLVWVGR